MRIRITITLDAELAKRLKQRCHEEHRPVSSGAAHAIARWLDSPPADTASTTTEQDPQP